MSSLLFRGTIVNRTCGINKNLPGIWDDCCDGAIKYLVAFSGGWGPPAIVAQTKTMALRSALCNTLQQFRVTAQQGTTAVYLVRAACHAVWACRTNLRIVIFFSITFTFQPYSWEVLPSTSFWTSRCHRCRPFSPPARAFIFCRA